MIEIESLVPHVSDKIEPGAILYSSWGYDQTNIDYYMVTRTTEKSCWVLPMTQHETQTGFMCGQTVPMEVKTHSTWCECKHRVRDHDEEYGCRGEGWGKTCDCKSVSLKSLTPKMHRIRNYGGSHGDCISLTSYSGAYLWDGQSKYSSHYA